jgi:hypothetical protein
MANGKGGRFFPGASVAALTAALLATACTTSPVEEVAMAPGRSGQPTDTGTFPNLNIPPQAATAQLTKDETQAKLAQLSALQRQQNPGATSSAETAEAKRKRLKLAADEQEETLKVIEGE